MVPTFSRLLGACCLLAFIMPANGQSSGYQVKKTFHINSSGGWDYIAVNPASRKLYVSHGSQVNILDKNSGDSLGVIPNTQGVHGIAFVPKLGKGYTSNGRSSNVTVFNLGNDQVLGQVTTGDNPDAIMYDAFSNRVITCNGRSKDLSLIDPATDKVTATIPVGGKPETAVSDEAGKLFVNIEDKNEIVEVDLGTNSVIARWSIAPADGPTGLAIDRQTHRLFAGCEKLLVVVDAQTGKIVSQLPIGEGCDGVAFDPTLKLVFTSNGSGTVTVIRENSASDFKVWDTVTTKRAARTIGLDEGTHLLYLPTAEFEPLPAGAPEHTRPKMVAGSFQVLMVGK